MAALGVNKVFVVASLMLLLFISSSLAVMADGEEKEAGINQTRSFVYPECPSANCNEMCIKEKFHSGKCWKMDVENCCSID